MKQSKTQIQKIEDVEDALNEGILDFVKQAASKAKQITQQAWNKVSGGLRNAVAVALQKIQNKIAELEKASPQFQAIAQLKAEAEQASGEKFPVDDTMKVAMNLKNVAAQANQELEAVKKQISAQIQQTPAQQPAPGVQEAFAMETTHLINEMISEYNSERAIQPLNEVLGVSTGIGLALGAMGGIPLLLKGLYKLSSFLGFKKLSVGLEHAYHVAHKIELKGIDILVPDRLSYQLYKGAWKKGFKTSKVFLQYEDYSANKQHAKQKVEGLVYKMLLIYFALDGLKGIMHAGSAALQMAEGTATTVKAIEIATGVVDAAAIIRRV